MAERGGREWKVEEVANHDVDKDTEVVSVEVFVGWGGGEEEVEEFKN